MRQILLPALGAISLIAMTALAMAEPAGAVLGKDYVFLNRIEGLPARLSEFQGLQINSFVTDDGVRLAYWEAGTGERSFSFRAGRPTVPSTST